MSTARNLNIHPGCTLGKRYKVEAILGEGTFGFVTRCLDTETNKKVAIKVNKRSPETVHVVRQEIAVLKMLQWLDLGACNIVEWNGFFFDKDNICLNFELLDQSLYGYLMSKNFRGLSMTTLRTIIYQLATALTHLSSMEIVHADIKPENIMVVDRKEKELKVKLIDFGLACPLSSIYPGLCLGTLWYRAPEIILRLPFNEAVDMWALGLIVVELVTGQPLYSGMTEFEILQSIIEIQGQPPDHMLDLGLNSEYYFDRQSDGRQRWTFRTSEQVMNQTWKRHKLRCLDDLEHLIVNKKGDQSDQRLLVDLVKKMLHLDPEQRIKPLEVLQHPFFTQNLPETSDPPVPPEISQWDQTAGPDTSHFRVQPEPGVENMGYLRRFTGWISNTFSHYYNYFFPR